MPDLADDTTTVHSNPQSMSSAEREAVKKGEARGKRDMEAADPKRFSLARHRGKNKKRFDDRFELIDWSDI